MEYTVEDIGKLIVTEITKDISTTFRKGMCVYCEIKDKSGNFKLTTVLKNTTQTFGSYYLIYLKSLQKI